MKVETYNLRDYEEAAPSTSLVESVRNFGYDLNTAVSDIIDNSITANADNISIRLEWNAGDPFVSILDNGDGMTEGQLSQNIVLGSQDPTEKREEGDLGRFGLGLKTASFSMCRQLNVFSKTEETDIAFRSWDLDIIREENKWLVSKKKPNWYDNLHKKIILGETGTLVLWKKCDRLSEFFDSEKKLKEIGVDLIAHIGTYFCRFLSGQNKIKITVNDTNIQPWSPIPEGSRSLSEQSIGNVRIHPYILPHHKEFKDQAVFEKAAGIKGWNAQQGVYIYRNDRLLINGGWLRLKKMKLDEHTKLARIIIDLDSSSDLHWHVDVSKSRASIPSGPIKQHIDAICRKTRKEAEEVYRHRGKVISRTVATPDKFIWKTVQLGTGETSFKINKDHPVIKSIYEKYSGSKRDLNSMFSLLEKLLPTESIMISGNSGKLDAPEIEVTDVVELAEYSITQQTSIGKSKKAALKDLLTIEPFNHFHEELREHFDVYE